MSWLAFQLRQRFQLLHAFLKGCFSIQLLFGHSKLPHRTAPAQESNVYCCPKPPPFFDEWTHLFRYFRKNLLFFERPQCLCMVSDPMMYLGPQFGSEFPPACCMYRSRLREQRICFDFTGTSYRFRDRDVKATEMTILLLLNVSVVSLHELFSSDTPQGLR